ncbi:MAG: CUB domain-containing protein, partial [Bacteroidota bacterium]
MKKIYLIFGLVFGLQTLATAQLTCGDTFTDSGGAAGEYQNDELDTITICAVSPTDVATITFSSFDLEEDYDFMYIIDGDLVTGTLVGTYTGANNPGTITSENIGGCMTIIFQSDESVTTAGWEAVIGCVAGPTCLRPSGITGSTTENSATLSWTANSGETSWGVEYGPAGFTQGTGTWMLTSSNPLTISGLTDLTSYDLYIYAKCSGVDSSTTLGPIAFSTNALPLTCGDMFYDTGVDTASYNADQNYIQVICPTTPGEVVVLTFSSFDTENNYDSLVIFNGNTTTDPILGIYQGTNSPGTIYSTNPNGCLTAWFSSDNIVQNDGWAATVTCQAPITCFTPTAVAVDTNTYDSGTISWTSAGAETMWAVEYGPAGFAQGSGTMEVASTNPYVITGLTELTDYDVYVRAICGAGDTSFYSGLASFTTGLAPLAPFICGNLFTDNGGVSTDYSANSNDTIVICPVNAGDVVVLSFTEFDTENGYDSLTVYNGNSVASPLLGIYQGTTSPGTIYSTDATGCLTAVFTSDDIVQNPGWSATISCQAPPTCAVPTALTVDANTDITATVSWTNGATETSWAIEYGAAGFAQGSGTSVIASTNPFTLTGLTGNTDYDVYVRAICGAGDTSFYSSSTSFTTDISATILPQLTCGEMFYDTGMDAADYS